MIVYVSHDSLPMVWDLLYHVDRSSSRTNILQYPEQVGVDTEL